MKFNPYTYQLKSIQFIDDTPYCALLLDMGLGKSVITLTEINCLLERKEISHVLIVAPKLVAENTWSQEMEKWDHLKHLTYSIISGTPRQRVEAYKKNAQIYVIGRDNLKWLNDTAKKPFYDMLVLDELTSFKNRRSFRWHAVKSIRPFMKRVVGLTGTPTPNGMKDMWAQFYCIDQGERLERTQGRFFDLYFNTFVKNYRMFRCELKIGAEQLIRNKIQDISLSMQAKDLLELPTLLVRDIRINLGEKEMKSYKDFEKENVLDLIDQDSILAINAAALCSKLAQYANGFVYDSEHFVHEVNDKKITALEELVEQVNESNILIFYQFQADAERIISRIPSARKYMSGKDLKDWNAGKIHILLAHPANLSYGLNLQQGGNYIFWFGTGWNSELYSQANARLYRQGQTKTVYIYRLICSGTIDEQQLKAVDKKIKEQDALMDYLKEKKNEKNIDINKANINSIRRENIHVVKRVVVKSTGTARLSIYTQSPCSSSCS